METKTLRYEDAAEIRDVHGWVCKTCGRFWGDDAHMARYCCCADRPCENAGCDGRCSQGNLLCPKCCVSKEKADWLKRPEIPWDGETPLYEDGENKYLFDEDDIEAFLESHPALKIEDLRLVICEMEDIPCFDVDEFLCDYLPEDTTCDVGEEINKIVNDWMEANAPESWMPGKNRPTLESVQGALRSI